MQHLETFSKTLVIFWLFYYPLQSWKVASNGNGSEANKANWNRTTTPSTLLVFGTLDELKPSSAKNNESASSDSEDQNSEDPYSKYLFYNETQKYYLYNVLSPSQGPCGKFMRLYKEKEDSFNGVCRCEEKTNCSGRPLIYWNQTQRCYYAYEQGPCGEGDWLVYNSEDEAECQMNVCPPSKLTLDSETENVDDFYFTHKGICHKTNTTAFCEDNKRVFFLGTNSTPICADSEPSCMKNFSSLQVHILRVANSSPISCPPNTQPESDNVCAKIVSFE